MAGNIANAILTTVVDAIGRQLGYLFSFKSNIKKLEEKVTQLEKSRDDVERFFEAHRWNNEEMTMSTAGWLRNVEMVSEAAKEVVEAKDKLKGWCLDIKNQYKLSRKSTKMVAGIQELQDQAPKQVATNPTLPLGILAGSSSNDASNVFKTRRSIMDKVMEALEDDNINIIGICGLGGSGKTTILHEVCKRASAQKLFDEFVMTTVSQVINLYRIQSDLATKLGEIHIKDVDIIIKRADLLHKRLTMGKRILVVLDDVWSEIELEEVGIPVGNGHARCKVVLASRNERVCVRMGAQKIISIEILSEEEAWHLFKTIAGDCVEREKLEEIAKEVAYECQGLPIALITLAKALSNKRRQVWEDVRRQLRQSCLTSIPGMNKTVYKNIWLSYDFLARELPEAQPLLLMCCQHPEDAEIEVEKLARYCLALELFKNVDKVVDARNRTYAVIEHLKSCFLLQEVVVNEEKKDWEDDRVRMHDIVRDVCLSIVSEVKEKVYMHIMVQDTDGGYEFSTSKVDYPTLKLLMEAPLDGGLLDISFLQRMEELRVFENLGGYKEYPPPALEVLANLRMLSLENVSLSKKITSRIGRLSRLEILSFWGSEILSFPHQIGQLRNLKLLDLRVKEGEGLIPSGILLGLNKLEELYMGKFILLGAANKDIQQGRNRESHGRITELDSLSNLTTLQIILEEPRDLQDLRCFCFEKLERFFLSTSRDIDYYFGRNHRCLSLQKTIKWGNLVGMKWVLGANIQFIVSSTVDLQLEDIEDWIDPLILEEFVSLKKLALTRCEQLEYVLPGGSLSELHKLSLFKMHALRHLWVGPTDPLCLGNLKEVSIIECSAMESIFPHSAAKCLVQLEGLRVENCRMLEGIVSKEELGTATTSTRAEIRKEPANDFMVEFPKLRRLYLTDSPNLRGFYNLKLDDGRVQQPLFNPLVMLPSLKTLDCHAIHQLKHIVGGGMLELPKLAAFDGLKNLEEVTVLGCHSLETVFDYEGLHVMGENAHVPTLGELKYVRLCKLPNLKHLCRQIPEDIYAFQNLGELDVEGCGRLGYLISSSMAHMLVNLKSLSVEGCESMKEVIEMNEDCGVKQIVFPSLSRVILTNLKKLSSFCSSDEQAFEFPSLEEMFIVNCPEMKAFCCGDLTAGKLHGVKSSPHHDDDDELVWMGDLNETVRHLNERKSKNFETRAEIMDEVMKALKDDTINIIGICGLGGIGKTTILHEVCVMARTQKLFDEVVMTRVGLTSIKDMNDIIPLADLLHKRLTNGSTILVVLDDVYSAIKLEEAGIPVRNGRARCKVVLASNSISVCNSMSAQKTIYVEVLSREEAWRMFKNTAGDCVEKEKLNGIAEEIADECRGLPIALVTLARALSNQKLGKWEDALIKLREISSKTSIPEIIFELSYNFLATELPEAQPLLWICCQHPKDAKIKVEKLARYCLALNLFKDVDKFVDARERTYKVIEYLKSLFLLQGVDVDVDEKEKDWKDEAVTMHDVIREACLSVVSDVKDKVYMHIVAAQDTSESINYRKLKLLMALDGSVLNISFLQRLEELRVFENLGGDRDYPSPPLQVLANLRMLSLEHDSFSKEITSTIFNLPSLEILSFWRSKLSAFPREIRQLSNLKLLDLRCSKGEGPIPSGILPELNKLEVLYMGNFILLGAPIDKDIQRVRKWKRFGCITELDTLSSLTSLQIILDEAKDLLDLQCSSFEKLESFFLTSRYFDKIYKRISLCPLVEKTIKLENIVGMRWILAANIQFIVRRTVDLQLEDIEDWTDPLILEEFVSLKKLDLRRCKQLQYIYVGSLGRELQVLKLTDMPAMRRLWVGPKDLPGLVNLKEFVIRECPAIEIITEPQNDFMVQIPNLRGWFSANLRGFNNLKLDDGRVQEPLFYPLVMLPSLMVLECIGMHQQKQIVGGGMLKLPKLATSDWLQNLQVVRVSRCDSLETVFDYEGLHVMGENTHVPTLGELKYVRLCKLPNLKHLCRQIPKDIYAFQNLGELDVEGCGSLGYLISSSMAHMLVNLVRLSVKRCKSMKKVIEMNEDCGVEQIVFRSLSRVILEDLDTLSSFCSSHEQTFKFPSLWEVLIVSCPAMKTFCYGHVTAKKLHGVKWSPHHDNDDELVWKDDLNETVRHLNERNWVNQMNSDLKKDDVLEESITVKCVVSTNEMESARRISSNFVESNGDDDEEEVLKRKGKEKVEMDEKDDDNDSLLRNKVVMYKFLDAMVEEVYKGNTSFSKSGWNVIINALKGYNITRTYCTNKFNELRNEYTCFKNICKEARIAVNHETGKIYAEAEEWEKLEKVIEGCDRFRKSGCPYFSQLQIIFGDAIEIGENAYPSTIMPSDFENNDEHHNSFASNHGPFMQQINENVKKMTQILEKQFGQASQNSETIRDSGGATHVKSNEDIA